LAFLRTVDAAEAIAVRVSIVQDFEGVAVEDGDDGAVKSDASTAEKENMKKPKVDTERISSLRLRWRATITQVTQNNEAENTVRERLLCITRPQTALPVRKFIMCCMKCLSFSRNCCFWLMVLETPPYLVVSGPFQSMPIF
jgi:hypothetical protein